MWPVAPKISHTLGVGGLASEGGSVLSGSERRAEEKCDEGEVGSSGDVAAIAACWVRQCYMSGWWEEQEGRWRVGSRAGCVSGDAELQSALVCELIGCEGTSNAELMEGWATSWHLRPHLIEVESNYWQGDADARAVPCITQQIIIIYTTR